MPPDPHGGNYPGTTPASTVLNIYERVGTIEYDTYNLHNNYEDLANKHLDMLHRIRVVERALSDLGAHSGPAAIDGSIELPAGASTSIPARKPLRPQVPQTLTMYVRIRLVIELQSMQLRTRRLAS